MRNEIRDMLTESIIASKTLEFIKKAHAGQMYGKDIPYWKHPEAVMNTGKRIFGSKFDITAQTIALLHDVVEDTKYTEEDLKKMGYTDEDLAGVRLVTKDNSLSYDQNIQRIISSGNKRAMMVKFADNYENYTGDKSGWTEEKRTKSQAKYKKSMQMLAAKLGLDEKHIPE